MSLHQPQDIYIRVAEQIDAIMNSLELLSASAELADARRTAIATFTKISEEITKHTKALQDSSEWDTYTIAFYGETNAGKSTLIETLRILLNEPSKVQARAEFIELKKQFDMTDDLLEEIQDGIAQECQKLSEVEVKLDAFHSQLDERAELLRQELARLQQLIAEKVRASLWQRLLAMLGWRFKKREIGAIELALEEVEIERDGGSAKIQQERSQIEANKAALLQRKQAVEALIPRLTILGDGAIIGDGSPDFTLATQRYHFTTAHEPFVLLDVPGIEGSEGRVKDEIWSAVRKAHAVFYVTSKAVAPQQGSDGQAGTLQKIQQHLGSQTEVWSIFNKRIPSPTPLKQAQLLNQGEMDSLQDLDQKMRGELGEHYRRTVSVSALPAFLALADCLPPASRHCASRAKFLAQFSQEQILEKTNLLGLQNLLIDELVKDNKKKIYRSNFNKANQVVLAATADISFTLKETFLPLGVLLKRNATMAGEQLDSAFESLKTRLASQGERAISNFSKSVGDILYAAIDTELSNDAFKDLFEKTIADKQQALTTMLPQVLSAEIEHFQHQSADIIGRAKELAGDLMSAYANIQVNGINVDIRLDIKLDNGINIPNLVGALAGGMLMLWNPAGWLVLTIGAITALIGVAKAVYGYFSANYRKAQQSKAVAVNLANHCKEMRLALKQSLAQTLPQVAPKIDELKTALRRPDQQVAKVVVHLARVEKQLKNISKDIETNGAL